MGTFGGGKIHGCMHFNTQSILMSRNLGSSRCSDGKSASSSSVDKTCDEQSEGAGPLVLAEDDTTSLSPVPCKTVTWCSCPVAEKNEVVHCSKFVSRSVIIGKKRAECMKVCKVPHSL